MVVYIILAVQILVSLEVQSGCSAARILILLFMCIRYIFLVKICAGKCLLLALFSLSKY